VAWNKKAVWDESGTRIVGYVDDPEADRREAAAWAQISEYEERARWNREDRERQEREARAEREREGREAKARRAREELETARLREQHAAKMREAKEREARVRKEAKKPDARHLTPTETPGYFDEALPNGEVLQWRQELPNDEWEKWDPKREQWRYAGEKVMGISGPGNFHLMVCVPCRRYQMGPTNTRWEEYVPYHSPSHQYGEDYVSCAKCGKALRVVES
jgi:hypothetical protein